MSNASAINAKETTMFKHILISTDGSKLSQKAVKAGLKLAASLNAKVTLYRAIDDEAGIYVGEGYAIPKDLQARAAREARAAVDADMAKARKQAHEANITCASVTSKTFSPWKGIVDTATGKGCDAIVMASHGRRGLGSLMVGSVTQKVLALSKIPVLVLR
jgi:nucleotide-binding universal stress UspA family protein